MIQLTATGSQDGDVHTNILSNIYVMFYQLYIYGIYESYIYDLI